MSPDKQTSFSFIIPFPAIIPSNDGLSHLQLHQLHTGTIRTLAPERGAGLETEISVAIGGLRAESFAIASTTGGIATAQGLESIVGGILGQVRARAICTGWILRSGGVAA